MESGNWKTRLQRKRTVNKIMDTLKRHLPLCGQERLQEFSKIAERVEDEVYIAATTQSEYSRKICFMMLTMETRLQTPISYSGSVSYDDSIAQGDDSNVGDWEAQVYQKIKYLKELYLRDTRPDWRTELQEDSRERIRLKIMETLKRHLPFSGLEGLEELNKIAVRFEGRIYAAATSQSDYLRKISLKMLTMETRSQNSMADPVW